MFGWLKKKAQDVAQARADVAAEAADDAHRMFSTVQGALGGMHPSMREDPFIVGALAMHAAVLAKVISNGQCPIAVLEGAMVRAMEITFASLGVDRNAALGLLFQFKNHPNYTKGTQVVTLIQAARFGHKDLQGDPLLVEARQRVRSMPKAFREAFGNSEEEQISSLLTQDLLVAPLKQRYGELWRRQ